MCVICDGERLDDEICMFDQAIGCRGFGVIRVAATRARSSGGRRP
jgi:hypothetical protein